MRIYSTTPRLCHLSLQNVADAQIKSIKNVSLESLNLCSGESSLVFNMDVTDNALLSLQPDLLRSLKWRTDAIISLTTMERLNRFKKLNELTLKMCDFRGVTFEPLKTQLTSLDLSYSKNISLQCLTTLKDFPLQQLDFREMLSTARRSGFSRAFFNNINRPAFRPMVDYYIGGRCFKLFNSFAGIAAFSSFLWR